MATLSFTSNLLRHVETPPARVEGATVREALETYFQGHPGVRSYVLDDQGALRKHVAIFRNNALIRDRVGLSDLVSGKDEPRRRKWVGGGFDFAGIHSILVDPRDPAHVTVGVSVGGVWTTRDSGAHWELIGAGLRAAYMPPDMVEEPLAQDPHRIVHCPTDPDRLWMQHHNGIFRSDDGGENWRELQNVPLSTFGFAVAVHPTEPDTAWFIPATKDEQRIPVDARVVVTRTRDGGEHFDVLTRGLPDEPAYDLVYRHALDVSGDGERLAFGSTTGSLWVSEDQGDSWQAVSKHLPPVACVRFEA